LLGAGEALLHRDVAADRLAAPVLPARLRPEEAYPRLRLPASIFDSTRWRGRGANVFKR
jgi:hypothetical protein